MKGIIFILIFFSRFLNLIILIGEVGTRTHILKYYVAQVDLWMIWNFWWQVKLLHWTGFIIVPKTFSKKLVGPCCGFSMIRCWVSDHEQESHGNPVDLINRAFNLYLIEGPWGYKCYSFLNFTVETIKEFWTNQLEQKYNNFNYFKYSYYMIYSCQKHLISFWRICLIKKFN